MKDSEREVGMCPSVELALMEVAVAESGYFVVDRILRRSICALCAYHFSCRFDEFSQEA